MLHLLNLRESSAYALKGSSGIKFKENITQDLKIQKKKSLFAEAGIWNHRSHCTIKDRLSARQ